VLALKGISEALLGEKEQGLKDIKDAIKLKISNPIPWHFMALYYKEEKNYEQVIKNYSMSIKYDKENTNMIRELQYCQLYLRHYNSFMESSKACLQIKPNMIINWVTYCLSTYLLKNLSFTNKIIDNTLKLLSDYQTPKREDLFELKQFKVRVLRENGEYTEALKYLEDNEKDFKDKVIFHEAIADISFSLKDYSKAFESSKFLFKRSPDNIQFLISLVRASLKNDDITNLDDILNLLKENSPKLQTFYNELLNIAANSKNDRDLFIAFNKNAVVDRVIYMVEPVESFKKNISLLIKNNIETTNPSTIVNLKWVYDYSKEKFEVLKNYFIELENEHDKEGTVYGSDIIPSLSWFYFILSSHYKLCKEYEKALNYINKAIDLTPSVIEFFTLKSVILKRVYQFDASEKSYEKAKKLDVGDRYLNAKHAKTAIRNNDINKSLDIMQEFVKHPLEDENLEHNQTQWYMIESIMYYLRNGMYAHADRLIRSFLQVFISIGEDQLEFFNYCLRRNVICSLVDTLKYVDKVYDHSNLYKALSMMEVLYDYFETLDDSNLEKSFLNLNETDFKQTQYKFVSFKSTLDYLKSSFMTIIVKLQPYSKDHYFHYLAVKFSLKNNKALLALKSLIFLKNKKSEFLQFARVLCANYISSVKDFKFKSFYETVDVELINKCETIVKESEVNYMREFDNVIQNPLSKKTMFNVLHIVYFYRSKKECFDKLNQYILGQNDLTKITYKIYSNFIILNRTLRGEEASKHFLTEFHKKFDKFSDPSISTYNLDFYDIFNENKKPKVKE
jgi:tetratricopeptide (TPR) repeat protein